MRGRRFAICALAALVLVLLIQPTQTPRAAANPDWWNANWPYRRPVTIANANLGWWNEDWSGRRPIIITEQSGNDLTDYQVKVSVTYNSDMQADFDDLRFTDSDGTTPLSYWIEDYTTSTSATVWVRVPSIPASSSKCIYAYYGNASVGSASSGADTFIVYDNFDDGTFTGWSTEGGSWSESGGILSQTTTEQGSFCYAYRTSVSLPGSYIISVKMREPTALSTNRGGILFETDTDEQYGIVSWSPAATTLTMLHNNVATYGTAVTGTTRVVGTWYVVEALRQTNVQKGRLWQSGSPPDWTTTATQGTLGTKAAGLFGGYDKAVDFDDFIVRKYIGPEPTAIEAGPIENFQVKVVINYDTDMAFENFQDLRFRAENGDAIPYWIESYNAGENAAVWLRYPWPIAASSSATVYAYYGNASVTGTTENGDDTFIFFDTFPGDDLDTTKWYKSGGGDVNVANSEMFMESTATANDPMVDSKENFGYNIAMKTRQKHHAYTMFGLSDRAGVSQRNSGGDGITMYNVESLAAYCYTVNNDSYSQWGDKVPTQDVYFTHEFRRTAADVKSYINDALNDTETTNLPDTNIHVYFTPYSCGQTTVDWVLIRKLLDPEPTASVGSEESRLKPNPPSTPYCEEQTNPTQVTDLTPEFSAIFIDGDSGDNGLYAHVQVGTTAGGNDMWDPGWLNVTDQFGGTLENNERCVDIAYPAPPYPSNWWNTDWHHRAPVTIGADHPENYQIRVVLDKAGDLNNNCLDNFQDLRFLEDKDSGELSFWIENYIGGDNAVFWVRREENSDSTIYAYYGNASAESVESGNAVFIEFFDGNDAANWTTDGGHTVQNIGGELRIYSTGGAGTSALRTFDDITYDTVVEHRTKKPIPGALINGVLTADDSISNRLSWIYLPASATTTIAYDPGQVALYTGMQGDTYYLFRRNQRLSASKQDVYIYSDNGDAHSGVLLASATDLPWASGSPDSLNRIYAGDTTGGGSYSADMTHTWIRIRKYASTEPTASVGSEETYAGSALSRGTTYHWRIRFKDNYGLGGEWSSDQTFTVGATRITEITADPALVDREVNQLNSGAVDTVRIYVTVVDDFGRDWIENGHLWIRDNTDAVVVGFDNLQLTSYDNIDSNTKRFWVDFDPDNLAQVGYFDVKAQAVDNEGVDDVKDYTGAAFGFELFEVNDLVITLDVADNTPIYQLATSGDIARASGTVSADNVVIQDNNEGPIIAAFDADNYNKTYGLVSPMRLHHGNQGQIYAWARDDTLDGVSSTVTYYVEGDNAQVSVGTINNQVGQSVVNLQVIWQSDSAGAAGMTYVAQDDTFQGLVSSGAGQLTLSYSTWILSGNRTVSFDNGDRPIWQVTDDIFTTRSLVYEENAALSGAQDSASLAAKLKYNDESTGATVRSNLFVDSTAQGEKFTDDQGLVDWTFDLPDNQQNIQIKLKDVRDSDTNNVVNARDVEGLVLYTESTTCTFTFTDNDKALYYGGAGSTALDGTLTSQASYVSLTVRENLHYRDNNENIDNTSVVLLPGTSEDWSFTLSPAATTYYTVKFLLAPEDTAMWAENARVTVKLSTPALTSPANTSGTIDNTPTFTWDAVDGAASYRLQIDDDPDFLSLVYDNETLTSTTCTIAGENALGENRYYWQVRALTTLDVENSDWSGAGNFWVDRTDPVMGGFTINSGAAETTSSTVTLTLSASDVGGSGAHQMCFKNESGSWSSWESYSTAKSWALSSGDGAKTVYARVRDKALNESDTLSDAIVKTTPSGGDGGSPGGSPGGGVLPPSDTTPPTLTVLEPTTYDVSESVTVRVSASDSSGIDSSSISVTLDGGAAAHTWASGIITSSITGLGTGGHLVVVTVKDASTKHNQASVEISFNVVEAAGENVETIENVVPEPTDAITVAIGAVGAGENAIANFDNENLSVSSVRVTISENIAENEVIEDIEVSAQILENAPAEAGNPPENSLVYAYLEICTTAPANALASVTIDFKVSRVWLQAAGIDPLAVTLYHLEGGQWVELPTVKVGEDNEFVYYSATAGSCSPFMIGGKVAFPTFILQLPGTPMESAGGFVQITLWATNPTPSTIVKHCELRFGAYVKPFDIEVQAGQDFVVAVYVDVAEVDAGTYDMKLYDADTNTLLDEGSVTLLAAVEQPETTPAVVIATPSSSPILPIAAIGVVGAVIGLGVLRITGRLPKIGMPRLPALKFPRFGRAPSTIKRRFGRKKIEEPAEDESSVMQGYHDLLVPAAHELLDGDSQVVQDYSRLLLPAARELAAKKEVKHLGRAVKPYKGKRAGRR